MASFIVESEPMNQLYVLRTPFSEDGRGSFSKLFHSHSFDELGIHFQPVEAFCTISNQNVLRGMHCQVRNAAHQKLVSCVSGKVLDVVVDVRIDSPFFNQPYGIILDGSKQVSLLIGKGYAHGFLSLADNSIMSYMTSTVYDQSNDKGVLWSSIDYDWPIEKPILSLRDSSLPSIGAGLCEFL